MAPILDSLHGSLLNPREFLYPAVYQALSQRKWCECWDFLPIIVNLLQNYSLPYNEKYLGVNVVCWHYINKIYLNLKLKWIEVIIWEVRPKSYCAIVPMKQNPVKR